MSGTSGPPVRVEVFVMGARDATIYYRIAHAELSGGARPDAVAAAVAAGVGGGRPAALLHSTSWRFDEGTVVLTYAAVLDGLAAAGARPLARHGIARSDDPVVPAPPIVRPDAVATHAVRHLAWLRGTDEVVATALTAFDALWHALDRYLPGLAGSAQPPILEGTRLG